MPATVLIIAPADDIHALAVQRRIAELAGDEDRVKVVDLATYPLGGDLSEWIDEETIESSLGCVPPLPLIYGPDVEERLARRMDAWRIDPKDIRAVWWRRPRNPLPHAYSDTRLRDFAQINTHAHIWSFFLSLPVKTNVVNSMTADARANFKPLQLRCARNRRLKIPRTLVTNNPEHATTFVRSQQAHGRECIAKQLRAVGANGYLTRAIGPEDAARFEQIRDAPVILQERIRGIDVRVVIVGDAIFSASQVAQVQTEVPDIRATLDTSCVPVSLPREVQEKLLCLHADLGLSFGAYDFIRTENGAWYLLEVNPSGQWLYVETAASLPIAEAFAQLLWHGAVDEHTLHRVPYDDTALDALIAPFQSGVLERARASEPSRTHLLDV